MGIFFTIDPVILLTFEELHCCYSFRLCIKSFFVIDFCIPKPF